MRQTLPTAGETATKLTIRADSRQPNRGPSQAVTVQTETDENAWFSGPARVLLGSDPGLALHVLTGLSESSGYRYASGDRPIPILPFRQLVFRPDGAAWHAIFMDGCTAQWWLDLQHQARIGRQVLEITKRE